MGPPSREGRRHALLAGAAVGVVTLAVFAPVLRAGFVEWDDVPLIVENPWIRSLSPEHLAWMLQTLYLSHWQPLTWLSFAVDFALFGLDPRAFHATSLGLHAVNAVLVFALAATLVRRSRAAASADPPDARALALAAALAALAFALHPLRVETVAWATDRGDLLAAGFLMLALLAYLGRIGGRSGVPWAVALYLLAVLSKAWAMVFPLLLLVVDAWVLRRFAGASPAERREIWLEKLPFFALAGASALISLRGKAVTAAFTSSEAHGPLDAVLHAATSVWFYPWKTLLPLRLSPLYPMEPDTVWLRPLPLACAAATLGVTLVLWRGRRRHPGALAVWAAYGVLLLPVSGLLHFGPQLAADRYSYLAAIPWAAGLAALLAPVLGEPARRRSVLLVATLLLAVWSALSIRQIGIWRDGVALWSHAVDLHPESGTLHYYLGNALRAQGRAEAAVGAYGRALELGATDRRGVLNNRAAAWRELGDAQRASADLEAALALAPTPMALYNRGLLRLETDPEGALADFEAALRLDPGHRDAHLMAGQLREARRDRALARAHYEAALAAAAADWEERSAVEARLARLRARERGAEREGPGTGQPD